MLHTAICAAVILSRSFCSLAGTRKVFLKQIPVTYFFQHAGIKLYLKQVIFFLWSLSRAGGGRRYQSKTQERPSSEPVENTQVQWPLFYTLDSLFVSMVDEITSPKTHSSAASFGLCALCFCCVIRKGIPCSEKEEMHWKDMDFP